ncbi:hypothetical protein SAMN06295970_112140 [Noviherbaspirillum suwonense]|uniref:Uncharacterized protein n=1 Tax=Noviherbaspirillum suwonense TaxID=1224511 RepID=A0ABY1QG36_9BURK|nr:hypothetical protein SAMN06295970_112140 [Noviherbaspirillum suwonense]
MNNYYGTFRYLILVSIIGNNFFSFSNFCY